MRQRFLVVGLMAVLCSAYAAGAADARGWSIQPTPNPAGAGASALLGVSCTRASACTAVGTSQPSPGTFQALAERWNGSTWEIQPTPNPVGVSFRVLRGVSCTSPRACMAVGDQESSLGPTVPLAERWNGRTWEVQPTPNPPGATLGVLYGVSCAGPRACTAVGQQLTSTGTALPLVERWDGASWEIQNAPIPAGASDGLLGGVSCTAARACTAVGYYITGAGVPQTLAERWNGSTWEIQPTPNPPVDRQISLSAVSCPQRRACTAVGFSEFNAVSTLAERWNGSTWEIQETPNPAGASFNSLSGVSCPARRTCTAVGGATRTLAERWDGSTWEIQPTPDPAAATDANLAGVSCPTRRVCTAVGTYFTSTGAQHTLAEGYSAKP